MIENKLTNVMAFKDRDGNIIIYDLAVLAKNVYFSKGENLIDKLSQLAGIQNALNGVYHFKGSVPTGLDLPSANQEGGDVYNIETRSRLVYKFYKLPFVCYSDKAYIDFSDLGFNLTALHFDIGDNIEIMNTGDELSLVVKTIKSVDWENNIIEIDTDNLDNTMKSQPLIDCFLYGSMLNKGENVVWNGTYWDRFAGDIEVEYPDVNIANKLYPHPDLLVRENDNWNFTSKHIEAIKPYMCSYISPCIFNGTDNYEYVNDDVRKSASCIYNPLTIEPDLDATTLYETEAQTFYMAFYQDSKFANNYGTLGTNNKDPLPLTDSFSGHMLSCYNNNAISAISDDFVVLGDDIPIGSDIPLDSGSYMLYNENVIKEIFNRACRNNPNTRRAYTYRLFLSVKYIDRLSEFDDEDYKMFTIGNGLAGVLYNPQRGFCLFTNKGNTKQDYISFKDKEQLTLCFLLELNNNNYYVALEDFSGAHTAYTRISIPYNPSSYLEEPLTIHFASNDIALFGLYQDIVPSYSFAKDRELATQLFGTNSFDVPAVYNLYNTGILNSIDSNFVYKVLNQPTITVSKTEQMTGYEPAGSIEFVLED